VHDRVSVSAICSFHQPLGDDLALWAANGITTVGVSVAKLDAHGWDDGVRRVRDAGLRVANLIGLGPFLLADPAQWEEQRARLHRAVDAAGDLGAECLVLTTGPAGPLTWEEAADALGAALGPVLPHARDRGVPIAIEHTNSLRVDVSFVHTLRDVIDLAGWLDTGVCVELNSCWAERAIADTISAGIDRLRLVQVSDFAVGTLCTPDRLVPGDGDVPLARLVGALLAAGYTGCFDLELIGPRIEAEGYGVAIPRAVRALTALLESLGA
jgi:sugar phosphate isomerase/epimerase